MIASLGNWRSWLYTKQSAFRVAFLGTQDLTDFKGVEVCSFNFLYNRGSQEMKRMSMSSAGLN